MAKSGGVGLPGSFKLNVTPPVDLGHYLDEPGIAQPSVKLRRKQQTVSLTQEGDPEAKIEDQERKAVEPADEPQVQSGEVVRIRSKESEKKATQAKKLPAVRRRQINMSPKTLEAFAELVRYVQEYSQQPDAAASEVMDAIVSAHYEARDTLSLSGVPARGRWGSPTAQAFKDALSRAFTNALIEFHSKVENPKASNG